MKTNKFDEELWQYWSERWGVSAEMDKEAFYHVLKLARKEVFAEIDKIRMTDTKHFDWVILKDFENLKKKFGVDESRVRRGKPPLGVKP